MTAGLIETGSAPLYTEIRETADPPLLLISGGGADGAIFDSMLEPLCVHFSVITYDRRGNSRSPRPDGWHTTSIEEQADDVARLIVAARLEDVRVFGTSWGAPIALDVALRYSHLAHTVVIHEAPLFSALPEAAEIAERRRKLTAAAVAAGDFGAAFTSLVQSNNGEVFDYMDVALRERLMGNARTFFELELPAFASYQPTPETLAAMRLPVIVSVGERSCGTAIHAATARLAAQMGVDLVELPGGHAPYLDRQPGPTDFGVALAALLSQQGR